MDTDDRLEQLQAELNALEERAGIREQTDDAASFSTSYALREIRSLVFSVPNIELRKQIIATYRELDRIGVEDARASAEKLMRDARTALDQASRNAENLPWLATGIGGAVAVGIGWMIFGTPGAIGGGVLALFSGQGHIAKAKAQADAAMRQARQGVEEANIAYKEALLEVEESPFSAREEETGEPEALDV